MFPNGLRDIIGGGHFSWPAGHATDDTDLTRAVLLAYRDVARAKKKGKENDVVKIAAEYMLDWLDGRDWPGRVKGSRPCDVGGATVEGLERYRQTRDPAAAGAGEGRAGNGSLMRCIPTGLFQREWGSLWDESVAISAVTHDDLVCTFSCAVYNTVVAALVEGKSVEEAFQAGIGAVRYTERLAGKEEDPVFRLKKERAIKKVEQALVTGRTLIKVDDLARNGPDGARNVKKALPLAAKGFVLESLTIAIAALFDERSLEEILIDVVRFGGDSDTNGAIAGGLLGARDGVDAIPVRWREKLQFREEFEKVVDEILSVE